MRACTSSAQPATMGTRKTRSASRAARRAEAVATGPLGALSHDELGIIFDGLADPLEPAVAVALSSTCLGLRTPLRAGLEVLKERHARAAALCRKVHRTHNHCSCTAPQSGAPCGTAPPLACAAPSAPRAPPEAASAAQRMCC